MANLPLAFGEILVGAILVDAGVKGASISDVVKGQATTAPVDLSGGSSSSASTSTTTAPAQPSSGPAQAQAMLTAAQSAVGGGYSQANHDAVSSTAAELKKLGTDCSGFVSYLMGPNGAKLWSQSYTTVGIPTAPDLVKGAGNYVTIWNNPLPGDAGHVFIQILGQWFDSNGSTGITQLDQSTVNQYLETGQYSPYHPSGL